MYLRVLTCCVPPPQHTHTHNHQERFLAGEDAAHFDYSLVDGDAGLDVCVERSRDEEEEWFNQSDDSDVET